MWLIGLCVSSHPAAWGFDRVNAVTKVQKPYCFARRAISMEASKPHCHGKRRGGSRLVAPLFNDHGLAGLKVKCCLVKRAQHFWDVALRTKLLVCLSASHDLSSALRGGELSLPLMANMPVVGVQKNEKNHALAWVQHLYQAVWHSWNGLDRHYVSSSMTRVSASAIFRQHVRPVQGFCEIRSPTAFCSWRDPGLDDAPRTPPERVRSCWQSPEGPPVQPLVCGARGGAGVKFRFKSRWYQADWWLRNCEVVDLRDGWGVGDDACSRCKDDVAASGFAPMRSCQRAWECGWEVEARRGSQSLRVRSLDAVEQKPGESAPSCHRDWDFEGCLALQQQLRQLPMLLVVLNRRRLSWLLLMMKLDLKRKPLPIKRPAAKKKNLRRPAAKDEIQGGANFKWTCSIDPIETPSGR